MKKIVAILSLIIVIGICGFIFVNERESKPTVVDTEKALTDSKNRYIIINNQTNQVINEAYICVENDIQIGDKKDEPNDDDISFYIPKKYDKYENFKIVLIDRYDLKYEKEVIANIKGKTEVVICEDDYVKQKGDWKKKIDKFFNGD